MRLVIGIQVMFAGELFLLENLGCSFSFSFCDSGISLPASVSAYQYFTTVD